jgi:hypothetical protein
LSFLAPYIVSLVLLVRSRRSEGHTLSQSVFGLGRESNVQQGTSWSMRGGLGKSVDSAYDARSGLVHGKDDGGMEMGGFSGGKRWDGQGERY